MKHSLNDEGLSKPRYPISFKSSSAVAALGLAGSLLTSNQMSAAVSLIDEDFEAVGTTLSTNSRVRTTQTNGNFWTDNTPASDWSITGGQLSNAATSPNSSVSEGVVSQVVATSSLANDLTNLTLAFDYAVGTTATLKLGLIGYTLNVQDGENATNTLLLNNGTANGAIQNNTQAELRYGDINLLTGADMTQSITNDLTFAPGSSGSHSITLDLASYAWHADEAAGASPANTPGLSGSITSIADFDFVVLVFINDLTTDPGATPTTLDNIQLVATVPEPSSVVLLGLGGLALIMRRRK